MAYEDFLVVSIIFFEACLTGSLGKEDDVTNRSAVRRFDVGKSFVRRLISGWLRQYRDFTKDAGKLIN